MLTLAHSDAASNMERWPAALPPEKAERCYYGKRAASRAWVDGLVTRGGIPRWSRIKGCGDPVPAWRVDGVIGWEHRWCRDRACYACARSRSRKLSTQLRSAAEAKATHDLWFVTLTRPRRVGETATFAWAEFQRCWERLRHTTAWKVLVIGGVRAMECTHSEGHQLAKHRHAGYHVHAHLLVELQPGVAVKCGACDGTTFVRGRRCASCSSSTHRGDGTTSSSAASLLEAWRAIVDGSAAAQCAVPLTLANVGQLSKYVTKMWDMAPSHAREVFRAAHGKRIIEGFGTWRRWKQWGAVETTPRGWFSCGISVRDLEAMPRDALVSFTTTLPGVRLQPGRIGTTRKPDSRNRASLARACAMNNEGVLPPPGVDRESPPMLRPAAAPTWRPRVDVAAATVGRILAALGRDARATWEHQAASSAECVERCATIATELRRRAQHEYGGEQRARAGPQWPPPEHVVP